MYWLIYVWNMYVYVTKNINMFIPNQGCGTFYIISQIVLLKAIKIVFKIFVCWHPVKFHYYI